MKFNRLIALTLALVLAFTLFACGPKNVEESAKPSEGTSAPSAQPSLQPSAQPTAEPSAQPSDPVVSDSELEPYPSFPPDLSSDSELNPYPGTEKVSVNLGVLAGPTGVGAAKLINDSDNRISLNRYNVTIAADNTELVAGLNNGTIDIATVASNVALNLYNKSGGKVQIIALGTLGVLHILEGSGGNSINSVEDLMGKTIYSAGQGANPEFILRYILTQYGMDPDNDVEIVFAEPAEITQKLMSGDIEVAMLPVPAATAAIIKGEGKIRAAIDITEAWNDLNNGSSPIMTAVVARTEFIKQNKAAVDKFLTEYAASIDYVNNNTEDASHLIAAYGITANATIAKQAIPQCHLVCITGKDMAPAISDYYMILFELNPSSIGGYLPDDGIYYVP